MARLKLDTQRSSDSKRSRMNFRDSSKVTLAQKQSKKEALSPQ
jgi:hypothetical protein